VSVPQQDSLVELPNGVRVVTLPMPQLQTAAVSIFVRSGSVHESRSLSGIGHVIEHMVFKGTDDGTMSRDARRINLDAERLGAEVNAHTDKDHTAFHMRGLAADVPAFVRMLGELVLHPSFPAHELEHEREVLLQEFAETEDDPMAIAFQLFDKACFGLHPAAQPVIGSRRNIERFTRDDLAGHVKRQYSGANIVVAAAGAVDPAAVQREAEALFGQVPRGAPNGTTTAAWIGGTRARRLAGSSQAHVVLGFPIPTLAAQDPASVVAAAVLGEGMSSPLMDQVREQRGLAYYTACSADVLDICGQFVIEASTAPDKLDEFLRVAAQLLRQHAGRVDPVDLDRARHQLAVRCARDHDRPMRRLEDAAMEVFVHGRLRAPTAWLARLQAVTADEVSAVFRRMLEATPSLAVTGKLGRATSEHLRDAVAAALA
jgi:predicted Zn-dependent peptidase